MIDLERIDQERIDKVVEFHGHMCASLALGIRAAEVALAEVGAHAADEEVVAVVETDMCAVDAIQFLTGCTFGKGNLIHRDHGKGVYTFIRRSDGKAVRVSARPGEWSGRNPEWLELFARVRTGTATPAEREAFVASQRERSARVLDVPLGELYDVREVQVDAPGRARILASIVCDTCGEATMETRVRRLDGRNCACPASRMRWPETSALPHPRSTVDYTIPVEDRRSSLRWARVAMTARTKEKDEPRIEQR